MMRLTHSRLGVVRDGRDRCPVRPTETLATSWGRYASGGGPCRCRETGLEPRRSISSSGCTSLGVVLVAAGLTRPRLGAIRCPSGGLNETSREALSISRSNQPAGALVRQARAVKDLNPCYPVGPRPILRIRTVRFALVDSNSTRTESCVSVRPDPEAQTTSTRRKPRIITDTNRSSVRAGSWRRF
jgi:hypothetical protein